MASTKRCIPYEDEMPIQQKKAKESASESLPSPRVVLNPADCDLDFTIECNGLLGYGLNLKGFGYCWSGARANVGITKGKYCFGCKVVSEQLVDLENTPPDQRHVCRLGVSRGDDGVRCLGESKHSYGFGGTGKFSSGGVFLNFGEKFGVGDTIVCCIDLESKPLATIGFSKNGTWLGNAQRFDPHNLGIGLVDPPTGGLPWGYALFPHVLLKNVVVQMQFGVEDGLLPQEGFQPWASAAVDGNAVMGPALSDRRDCEVIMMVGLPASGKTTWAEKWVKDHPEKRYVLLGTNLILDQMKVPGVLRKNNYGERFNLLMDRATEIFNVMISKAATIPRNYIIDQTNVYINARKRKLKAFADFQKIAVVAFPKPEELKMRSKKIFEDTGKEVPADALNEMIANYVLPKSRHMAHPNESFDQVNFIELDQDESQKYLDQMKQDLASLSNNNQSTLPRGSSFQSNVGPTLQNQGSLAGSGIHWQGSYTPISQSNYEMPSQVNIGGYMTEPHVSMDPLSGGYPNSQISNVARAPSACGPVSNNDSSHLPRDNAGYNRTYRAVHVGDTEAYCNPVVDGEYRPNIVGSGRGFHGAFPYPNRSDMNEGPPISSARAETLDYNTHGRPYDDNRCFPRDLHTDNRGFHGAFPDPSRSGMNETSLIASARTFEEYGAHERPYDDNRYFRHDLHTDNRGLHGAFPDPLSSSMNETPSIASARTSVDYGTLGRAYDDNRCFRPDLHTDNMGFHGAFPDLYRRGMNDTSSVASARTSVNYGTHGRSYDDSRCLRSDLHMNNMGLHGAIPDPYSSGMSGNSPIASARTTSFNESTGGRSCDDSRGFQPDPHSLISHYGTPTPRPPYGELPDNMQYPGRYVSQLSRYP